MKSFCDNCDWVGEPLFELHEIPALTDRIHPGGVIPSGECPECDCLCYPLENCELKALQEFVAEVETQAEANMLKTHKLEGAHYAAMKTILAKREQFAKTGHE